MKTAFRRDEMIIATIAAKNFGEVVADLSERRKEKMAVVRNNEITAVILPVEDYVTR